MIRATMADMLDANCDATPVNGVILLAFDAGAAEPLGEATLPSAAGVG